MAKLPDIYFMPEYGKLYEEHEGGTLDIFSYESSLGCISCQFIKRQLRGYEGFEDYFDITTPYGYGGPVILECENGEKEELVAGFKKAFTKYCADNKIVSFFIRFHPIIKNAADFVSAFDRVEAIRKTIAIDLTKDVFNEEFNPIVRKHIRKAGRAGLTTEYDYEFKTIENFIDMYISVMDSHNASTYYYFHKDYFYKLKAALGDHVALINAVFEGEIVSSLIYFEYGDFIHNHFSASSDLGYKLNATELIKSDNAVRASKNGFKWYHMGGGVTNSPDDSLYLFKRKFTKSEPFDFYIGKSVYNEKIYKELCRLMRKKRGFDLDADFFPTYRG